MGVVKAGDGLESLSTAMGLLTIRGIKLPASPGYDAR